MEFVGAPLVPSPFEKTDPISIAKPTTPAPAITLRPVLDSSEDDRLDIAPPPRPRNYPNMGCQNCNDESLRKLPKPDSCECRCGRPVCEASLNLCCGYDLTMMAP